MKKIGLICLALVLALGALGVGYATWSDTINISGNVNTGDVDIDIAAVSSTFVYKILTGASAGEMVVHHVWGSTDPSPPLGTLGTDYILVASAVAVIDDSNTATVTMTNLFPSADFKVDFLLHYDGSVPARIKMGAAAGPGDDIVFEGTNADFFNALWPTVSGVQVESPYLDYGDPEVAFYGEMWECDSTGTILGENIPDLEGYQLHECEYILVVITLHLPQDTPMDASASFTATITAVQWNEY